MRERLPENRTQNGKNAERDNTLIKVKGMKKWNHCNVPSFSDTYAWILALKHMKHNILNGKLNYSIIAGLIFGKVIGIFGISWLAIKLKIAKLPENTTMSQIFGVSFLGGIGFTMSIFVAELAFLNSPELIFQAKAGILCASLIAGLFGYFWLKSVSTKESQ